MHKALIIALGLAGIGAITCAQQAKAASCLAQLKTCVTNGKNETCQTKYDSCIREPVRPPVVQPAQSAGASQASQQKKPIKAD